MKRLAIAFTLLPSLSFAHEGAAGHAHVAGAVIEPMLALALLATITIAGVALFIKSRQSRPARARK
ncbi:MAG: hypothetical protein ACKVGZ_21235 [Alphaproteobacteria bacterium]|jgi:hypothetical protein